MSVGLTPAERSLRARVAAHAMHAAGKTNTGPATVAQLSRFERQVDPDGVLPPDERARRAGHALKAHMSALALKASRAKTRKAQSQTIAPAGIKAGAITSEARDVAQASD